MSLVVHKLVLSPGGASTNTQNPTHHVTLAAYTHTPRSSVSETMGRSLEGSSSVSVNAPSSLYSSSSSSKHSSAYNLPFVLQDHNYGAPPPPTPPQSPPPQPITTSAPTLYHLSSHQATHHQHHHVHQTHSHTNNNAVHHNSHHHPHHHHPNQSHTQHHINIQHHQPQHHQQHYQQHHLQQQHHLHQPQQKSHLTQHQTISNVIPSPRLGIVTSSNTAVSVSGISTSHPLTVMPPHRQQFMPHPKASIFPSPHIPPLPIELHQTSTAVPTPISSNMGAETDDDSRLSDRSSSVGPSGEETETAPEGEGDEQPMDDSITRCICDFSHDDGYMIQCDRCFVWQHVDCMEIDRNNIPDEYLCEACEPRRVDRFKARALQIRRRQEIKAHLARLSSSDSDDNMPMSSKSRGSVGKPVERKVVKKKKAKQVKEVKNSRKGSICQIKKSNIVATCNNNIVPETEEKERRMLVKTRRRKSSSMSGGEIASDDSSGGPVERLRAWVEDYEIAVTNHYSPELRARVHAARINGVSPDLRASTQGAVLGHRCKVMQNPRSLFDVFDSKILVAATRLTANTAITEYQGKYLLASQWNAQQPLTNQVYLPYVLQYHMPKEGLSVCVDARTYGNDARFTRRSCRPNAEVRHVVERGSLHLYLVATRNIEESEEVTLALETANSTVELICCYPEDHDCFASQPSKTEQVSPTCHPPIHKKNGVILNNKKLVKKQNLQPQLRMSKRTTSTESRSSDIIIPPVQNSTPVTPVKQRRASGCGKSPVKSPCSSIISSPEESSKESSTSTTPTAVSTLSPETPKTIDRQQQQKMTREERKIAAYMKAFERMEKLAQRRQEMEKKKEEDKGKDYKDKEKKRMIDGEDDDWEKTSSADESVRNTPNTDRCRRKGKKGRGKGSPQKRNSRVESTASDLTGDESSCASVGLMSPVGGSIEGIALNFNSPPQGNSSNIGFRFPKTKKALMNEWLNETVDPVMPVCSVSGIGDVPSGVPTCYMRSPATPLRRSCSVNQGSIQGTILNMDMPGGSAKKRWLRQAISEETESPHYNGLCPSPNSRPDSPTSGGDYITPLKKRRLARESMSSEHSSTPPTTPVHSTSMEDDKLMMEEMEAELAEVASKDKVDDNGCEDHSSLLASAKTPCESDVTKDIDLAEVKKEDPDDKEEILESEVKSVASKILKEVEKGKKVKKNIKTSPRGTPLRNRCRTKAELSTNNTSVRSETSETEDEDDKYPEKVTTRSARVESSEETKEAGDSLENKLSVKARKLQKGKKAKTKFGVCVRRSERQQISAIKKELNIKLDDESDVCTVESLQEECKNAEVRKEEENMEELDTKHESKEKDVSEILKVKDECVETKTEESDDIENNDNKCEVSPVKEEHEKLPLTCKEESKEQSEMKVEEDDKEGLQRNEEHNQMSLNIQESIKIKEESEDKEDLKQDTKERDMEIMEDNNVSKQMEKEVKNLASIPEKLVKEEDKTEKYVDSKNKTDEDLDSKNEKIEKDVDSKDDKSENDVDSNNEVTANTDEKVAVDENTVTVKEQEVIGIEAVKLDEKLTPHTEEMEVDISENSKTKIETVNNEVFNEVQTPEVDTARDTKEATDDHTLNEDKCSSKPKQSGLDPVNDFKKAKPKRSVFPRIKLKFGMKKTKKAVNKKVKVKKSNGKTKPVKDIEVEDEMDSDISEDLSSVLEDEESSSSKIPEKDSAETLSIGKNTSISRSPSPPPFDKSERNMEDSIPRPRTPEGQLIVPMEMKGPRTPEGPAPSSPDEPTFTPPSPRSPLAEMRSPSPLREISRSPDRILKSKGPCTPPSLPPLSPSPQVEEDNKDGSGGLTEESFGDNDNLQPTTSQPKPAPVKRKLSILEYRKRKSVNSETDVRGATSMASQNNSTSVLSLTSLDASTVSCGSSQEAYCSPFSPASKDLSDVESPPSPASPPDLQLSPIQPLSLMLIPDVLDKSQTKEELKKEDGVNKMEEDSAGTSTSTISFGCIKNGNISSSSNKMNTSLTKINSVITDSTSLANRSAVSKQPTKNDSLIPKTSSAGRHNVLPNNIKTVSKVPVKVTSIPMKNSMIGSSLTSTEIMGTSAQDVKWNAAPTLLERQRENLTERLRREFGLCVSDDDEEKLDDDRERLHKRAKDKNLPPPPPPSSAPPKNSIFHGREVTVQKVPCSTKLGPISGSSQASTTSSGLHNMQANNCHRLPSSLPQSSSHSASHIPNIISSYSGAVIPPHLPVPPPPASENLNPSVSGLPMSVTSLTSAPPPPPPPRTLHPPLSLSTTSSSELASGPASIPVPCTAAPPRGAASASRIVTLRHSPSSAVQSMGDAASRPRLPLMSNSGQINQHLPTTIPPPPSSYPLGSYPRNIYPSPSGALPQSLSMYSPVRVAPPPPNSDVGISSRPIVGPASVRQPPPPPQHPPPPHGPPGVVAPSLVYNNNGYPGLDCSAPGSRGS